jgi:hypothetical protein
VVESKASSLGVSRIKESINLREELVITALRKRYRQDLSHQALLYTLIVVVSLQAALFESCC